MCDKSRKTFVTFSNAVICSNGSHVNYKIHLMGIDIEFMSIAKLYLMQRGCCNFFVNCRTNAKFLFLGWKNVLGLTFQWLSGQFHDCLIVRVLCSGMEISLESTPDQFWGFWGWVFNPGMFLCYGVYSTPTV